MASGLAPRLPLVFDDVYGPYGLITDFSSLAKQNLKMLELEVLSVLWLSYQILHVRVHFLLSTLSSAYAIKTLRPLHILVVSVPLTVYHSLGFVGQNLKRDGLSSS